MGLDSVEIIMEIEDEFQVVIPESVEWVAPVTVRQIVGTVQAIIEKDRKTCPSAQSFWAFRRALVAECGVLKRDVRPSTPLDSVVPRQGRRELWRGMQARMSLAMYSLPMLAWTKSGRLFRGSRVMA